MLNAVTHLVMTLQDGTLVFLFSA